MMKQFFFTIYLLAFAINGMAAKIDSTAMIEHHSLWNNLLNADNNPVLKSWQYKSNLSCIYATLDYKHANKALITEMGDGHSFYDVAANSYQHLSPTTTIWGGASYRNGTKNNIKFCSTADYQLLTPYVLADSMGGNLNNERYMFHGGISHTSGNFTWGASINFRAEHEYRTTDPRPRSIVTDLSTIVSAAYRFNDYRGTLAAGVRFYKQTNTVKFFREEGVIPEYHMTGLGSDYVRFSGNNNSTYYKATGLISNIAIEPYSSKGFFLQAAYNYTPFRKILPDLNALPFATLFLTQAQAKVGYKHNGELSWAAYVATDLEQRLGDEHISGSSSGTEYRTLIDLTMYHSHLRNHYATGLLQITPSHLTFQLTGGYIDYDSKYEDPRRAMDFSKAYGELQIQWAHHTSHNSLLVCNIGASYYDNLKSNMVMPYMYMDEARTQLVNDNYESAQNNYLHLSTSVLFSAMPQSWKGYGYFLQLSSSHTSNSNYNDYSLNLSLGITL